MFQLSPVPDVPWVAVGAGQTYAGGPITFQARCQVCGAEVFGSEDDAHAFANQHASHPSASPTHLGAGDVVAQIAKSLGFTKPCTPCEARRRALNAAMPRVPFTRR